MGLIWIEVSTVIVKLIFLVFNSGKICEPTHFPRLNKEEALENYFQKAIGTPSKICAEVVRDHDIYYPAYEPATKKCILQGQAMLYSCVGAESRLRRICPCRDYIRGQTALCANCLWHKSYPATPLYIPLQSYLFVQFLSLYVYTFTFVKLELQNNFSFEKALVWNIVLI